MKNSTISQSSWLKENDIKYIQSLMSLLPGIKRVRIFGSRAKGDWKSWSDIDLAIEWDITHSDLSILKTKLQYESPFPFSTDVIEYGKVDKQIRDHIDRVWMEIYTRKN